MRTVLKPIARTSKKKQGRIMLEHRLHLPILKTRWLVPGFTPKPSPKCIWVLSVHSAGINHELAILYRWYTMLANLVRFPQQNKTSVSATKAVSSKPVHRSAVNTQCTVQQGVTLPQRCWKSKMRRIKKKFLKLDWFRGPNSCKIILMMKYLFNPIVTLVALGGK